MRRTKAILLIILASLVMMLSISKVKAYGELVELLPTLSPTEYREGLEVYSSTATSRHNGGDRIDNQRFQAIVRPGSAETVEVVSWTTRTKDGWSRATLKQIASDFQFQHPGYIVLGAINGDFFHIQGNYEPQNNFVSDGDVIKKDSRYKSTTRSWFMNVVGIKDDGSFVNGPAYAEDNITLKLLNGKQVTEEFEVDAIGSVPAGDGIGLFYPGSVTNLNVEGYTVYKGAYDILRESTDLSEIQNITGYIGDDLGQSLGSFVRGSIVEVRNDLSQIATIGAGEFYLVSKNAGLASKLVTGTKVKCEYDLTGDFAGIKNTMGYSIQCLKDGVPFKVNATDTDYHVTSNPRSLVGFKPDGSVVFMTIDGRQGAIGAVGCSTYEAGEFLRLLGCTDGFNLDGGGSSELILRNARGGFDILNSPSDGFERQVANALLFVIRDPKIEVTEVTANSLTVEQTGNVAEGTIQNVRVQISGGGLGSGLEYQPLVDNKVTFTGLTRDTKYTLTYEYDILDEESRTLHSEKTEVEVSTLGPGVPIIDTFRISSKNGNQITIEYVIETDEVTNIVKKYLAYGDLKFDFNDGENEGELNITDLTSGATVEFQMVIEYKLNDEDKVMRSEVLSYTVPTVEEGKKGCFGGCKKGTVSFLFLPWMLSSIFLFRKRHS